MSNRQNRPNRLVSFFHYYAPSHLRDPFGLVLRLLRSKDPAARFALGLSLLGVVLTPLDVLLQLVERRRYPRSSPPRLPRPAYRPHPAKQPVSPSVSQPLIFVCGASRTGTTLVSQVLIKHLPVSYVSNLTALFPRSPLTATRLFRRLIRNKHIKYTSYYGKSLRFSGPNEGFSLWNRWMKTDQWNVKYVFDPDKSAELNNFWSAYQELCGQPVLTKHNNLNVCASDIAQVLENAYFICMTREPSYLAQSLLQARVAIQGDITTSYGVDDPCKSVAENQKAGDKNDVIQDVGAQVRFHERTIKDQQRRVGPKRFWIVSYEDFCQQPAALVQRVAKEILHISLSDTSLQDELPPLSLLESGDTCPRPVCPLAAFC
jgi:hypothetical protein